MKRKSWIYVLSSLCILIGTFCLSGCGNSEQEEPVAENTIITRQTVQEEKAKKEQAVNKEGHNLKQFPVQKMHRSLFLKCNG